jgi:hypothetical protein
MEPDKQFRGRLLSMTLLLLAGFGLAACTESRPTSPASESEVDSIAVVSTAIVSTTVTVDANRVQELENLIKVSEVELVSAEEADKSLSVALDSELSQLASPYRQALLDYQREIQCGYQLLDVPVLGFEGLATESRVSNATVDDLRNLANEIRSATSSEWRCGTPRNDRDSAFGYPGWKVENYYGRYRKGYEALWDQHIPNLVQQLSQYKYQIDCKQCYEIRDSFESEWEVLTDKRARQIGNISETFYSQSGAILLKKSQSRDLVLKAEASLLNAKSALSAYLAEIDRLNKPSTTTTATTTTSTTSRNESRNDNSPRYICGIGGCIDTWEPPLSSSDRAVTIRCEDFGTTAGCTITWNSGRKSVANPYAPRSGQIVNGTQFFDMFGKPICVDLYENGGIRTAFC